MLQNYCVALQKKVMFPRENIIYGCDLLNIADD